jgi:hypothetical protein
MNKSASFDLTAILDRLHSRREFLELFGKCLGYSALASALPACGGGTDAGAVFPEFSGPASANVFLS